MWVTRERKCKMREDEGEDVEQNKIGSRRQHFTNKIAASKENINCIKYNTTHLDRLKLYRLY